MNDQTYQKLFAKFRAGYFSQSDIQHLTSIIIKLKNNLFLTIFYDKKK